MLSVVKYAILLGALCNVLAITRLVNEEAQQNSILFEPLKKTTSIAFDLAKTQWSHVKARGDE